jgi:glycosyltransferase involved in cell wall biosynthesis
MRRLDPQRRFLRYLGPIPFEKLHELRERAEVFIFASSCENMPNILLEAMASAFPIACARRGPMPDILGEAGVYFDPERVEDIQRAIRELAADAELRARCAEEAHRRAAAYSWERCARDTFAFIARIARSETERSPRPEPLGQDAS